MFWSQVKTVPYCFKILLLRMNRQSPGNLGDSGPTLHCTVMVDTCLYTFAQTHRPYSTSSEQTVNCELWVMMCQRRAVDGNKCTTLVGEVDHRSAWEWGPE